MMKNRLLFLLAWCGSLATALACTGLLAGRNATTDGSTLITYNADSHTLYGELYFTPAADYPEGTMLDIHEWDTGKYLGQIPQVEHTYSVVGNMNEHQLSITESTWGGRSELQDTTGILDYGSLIYIALQRATNAREAIEVMTSLVKEYGYYSSGESFSIADPNEVWVMELIGKGSQEKGAVWVAIRIPDDCISAHANHSRIHTIPFHDNEGCLHSKDVISFAREMGYYDGLNKDFSFSAAYAPADFLALRACEARVWSFFNKYSDSMNDYLPYLNGESKEPMPLYIKPSRKLSVQDMKNAMRDCFEGTPFDMSKDLGAGAYETPYRARPLTFEVDSVTYFNERAIATQQTGFTLVAQMRNWLPNAIGGVLWFGVDDANLTVYSPIYCSVTEVPECFKEGNGDMLHFSWSSAFWIHNWVANMVYARYNQLLPDLRLAQAEIENNYTLMQPATEETALALYQKNPALAKDFLTHYSVTQAQAATATWKSLGEFLLVKFIDWNTKVEVNGVFQENGNGLPASPETPGYSEKFYRAIVKDTGDFLKLPEE